MSVATGCCPPVCTAAAGACPHRHLHAPRTKQAKMPATRSGTWPPFEAEGERALARVTNVIFGIGDVKNTGLGRAVFQLQGNGGRPWRCI